MGQPPTGIFIVICRVRFSNSWSHGCGYGIHRSKHIVEEQGVHRSAVRDFVVNANVREVGASRLPQVHRDKGGLLGGHPQLTFRLGGFGGAGVVPLALPSGGIALEREVSSSSSSNRVSG